MRKSLSQKVSVQKKAEGERDTDTQTDTLGSGWALLMLCRGAGLRAC